MTLLAKRIVDSSADGNWMVKLDKLKASSEPQKPVVKGGNTLTVNDVLIGEVWLGSGHALLPRLVLHDVYAQPIPVWTGPLFHAAQRDGEKMVLTFDHATGLKAGVGNIEGFAIAGEDQNFVWAKAAIDGEKVTV